MNILRKINIPVDILENNLDKITEKSKVLVQYFYYFYTFFIITKVLSFDGIKSQFSAGGFDTHWLIFWSENISLSATLEIVKILILFIGFLTLILYKKKWMRIIVFISFLQVYGVFNSISSRIDHSLYTIFFVLLFFMLAPNIWDKEPDKQKNKIFNTYIWGAQSFVLLAYTMVGINKIITSVQQWFAGDMSLLSPYGLSVVVAHKSAEFNNYVAFSDLFVNNPWLGFIASVISVYILTFSIVAAFRPSLHIVWGMFLIFYHLMTFSTIGLGFFAFIGVDIFLFLNSPFTPKNISYIDIIKDLPIIGWTYKKIV